MKVNAGMERDDIVVDSNAIGNANASAVVKFVSNFHKGVAPMGVLGLSAEGLGSSAHKADQVGHGARSVGPHEL